MPRLRRSLRGDLPLPLNPITQARLEWSKRVSDWMPPALAAENDAKPGDGRHNLGAWIHACAEYVRLHPDDPEP